MQTKELERRREKLSRVYELTSEARLRMLGFHKRRAFISKVEFLKFRIEYQFLSHYFGAPPHWRLRLRRFGGKRTLPDFCIIGPIKGGTSDLAVNMLLHPNVLAPIAKEFYIPDPNRWPIFYPTQRQKRSHARRHGTALCPYFGPYLHWMELTHNLSQLRPQTKVVLVLREPAKRFFSQWKWEKFLSGRIRANNLPFLATFSSYVEHALMLFPEYPMYTACGFQPLLTSIYWKAVKYWIECFGQENVQVLDIDDYFKVPGQFLQEIYSFVGLPPFEMKEARKIVNENPLKLGSPDDDSILKLREFFRPHNEMLWSIIDKKFEW